MLVKSVLVRPQGLRTRARAPIASLATPLQLIERKKLEKMYNCMFYFIY